MFGRGNHIALKERDLYKISLSEHLKHWDACLLLSEHLLETNQTRSIVRRIMPDHIFHVLAPSLPINRRTLKIKDNGDSVLPKNIFLLRPASQCMKDGVKRPEIAFSSEEKGDCWGGHKFLHTRANFPLLKDRVKNNWGLPEIETFLVFVA
ncbi:hypothetical protein CEXT_703121 [Caerostris extrusa]|uniref:Uncharacterized protein n=1 Tax=Caerostris extrusa TaxID=172846 RepID=A0AAV4XVB5_CAEEX|nr:hypothetical protein CEXT_703121 [Caerostris extrusa]